MGEANGRAGRARGRTGKPPSDATRPLTARQQRFAEEYLVDLDASAAARRAGYSARTAGQIGYQLLQKTSIRQAISAGQLRLRRKAEVSAERVVRELARVGFADPRPLFRPDGTLKDLSELDGEAAAAVASLVIREEYRGTGRGRRVVARTKKVRLWNKVSALEQLGRHLGLFPDRV